MTQELIDKVNKLSQVLSEEDISVFRQLYLAQPETHAKRQWLYMAASRSKPAAVEFLLAQGRDPNESSGGSVNESALAAAAGKGTCQIVRILLNAGASLHTKLRNQNGLFGAIYSRSLDCARLLVEAGIDIHKIYEEEDCEPRNALSFAEDWGCPDIAEYLRSKGAVLPEGVTSIDDVAPKDWIFSAITHGFESEAPKRLESFSLGEQFGEAELFMVEPSNATFLFHSVFTLGMSNHTVATPTFGEGRSRIELIMHLPFTWPMDGVRSKGVEFQWPLKWIRTLAQNILDQSIPLPGTHLIISNDEPPQPLGTGTEQTCILLIADFYEFFPVAISKTEKVHFYHVIPLYTEERDFEKKHGMQDLLIKMSTIPHSLVANPSRKRFVKAEVGLIRQIKSILAKRPGRQ